MVCLCVPSTSTHQYFLVTNSFQFQIHSDSEVFSPGKWQDLILGYRRNRSQIKPFNRTKPQYAYIPTQVAGTLYQSYTQVSTETSNPASTKMWYQPPVLSTETLIFYNQYLIKLLKINCKQTIWRFYDGSVCKYLCGNGCQ